VREEILGKCFVTKLFFAQCFVTKKKKLPVREEILGKPHESMMLLVPPPLLYCFTALLYCCCFTAAEILGKPHESMMLLSSVHALLPLCC
jgi:hypothetical protein